MRAFPYAGLVLFTAALTQAQTPQVNAGGVVDAASFHAPVVPGSLVSIFGSNLAPGNAGAVSIPLPLSLAGVSVTFNGISAPLLFVSPTQINAQLPWEVAGNPSVTVAVNNNQHLSAAQAVQTSAFDPGIFTIGGQPVAINPDGTLAAPTGAIAGLPSHPATPGDTIILYASGLGAVSPPPVTGNNSIDQLRRATATPVISIGGTSAQVTFAGLSPQFVGVYQIDVTVPAATAPGASVTLQIQTSGVISSAAISVGAGWPQWSQNPQHTSAIGVAGQSPSKILANVVYDPLVPQMQAFTGGELLSHYQAPLVDANDVYMEFKSGTFNALSFASEVWGENKFSWENGQLVEQWSYTSDWVPPGSLNDFWEPVFHAALANDAMYLPGANGSLIELNKADGAAIRRVAPFGTDPNTYETGPITVDAQGNLLYNVIRVTVDPTSGFYANDAIDSWLVKVAQDGTFTMASYKTLTAAVAPGSSDACLGTFDASTLPWPPSNNAVPPTSPCGTQRVGLNVSPAIGPDGTIYSLTRAQFNDHYSFLVALNPDLTEKWVVSLRGHLIDGCGVPVADGGWLPANGTPGGCRSGANLGVDPETNLPGDGRLLDSASSTPVVAPDGTILVGTYTRYNYEQGHMLHFDAAGNYLGAFGFGWDTTPAIYVHDGTWSAVTKNNHYGGTGSYCFDSTFCPPDRTSNNPASPEQYFVTQFDASLAIEWSYLNTNTQSCVRNPDGTRSCVSDHPNGFEWCVNAPVVDANGTVYANSEDGNLYVIPQGGASAQAIFQELSLGAAYTPASLGGDGTIYSQNDGILFAVGH